MTADLQRQGLGAKAAKPKYTCSDSNRHLAALPYIMNDLGNVSFHLGAEYHFRVGQSALANCQAKRLEEFEPLDRSILHGPDGFEHGDRRALWCHMSHRRLK